MATRRAVVYPDVLDKAFTLRVERNAKLQYRQREDIELHTRDVKWKVQETEYVHVADPGVDIGDG
jgi:hypothetical protein